MDIRKTYFNALPTRAIYMRLPKEMGMPPDVVARQVRCVYGTRDAGKSWEDTYTLAMENMGFTAGTSNPCVFGNEEKQLMCVVHGDNFTTLGLDEDLNEFEQTLQENFEIKIRGRLGEGCPGPQEIRMLNRIVSITEEGLTYEADPRHTDLLLSSLNLDGSNSSTTPWIKPTDRNDFALKADEPQGDPMLEYADPSKVIASICAGEFEVNEPTDKAHNESMNRAYRQCIENDDPWIAEGECGLWIQKQNQPQDLLRSSSRPSHAIHSGQICQWEDVFTFRLMAKWAPDIGSPLDWHRRIL